MAIHPRIESFPEGRCGFTVRLHRAPEHTIAMWAQLQPDDPADHVDFYHIDKGWWRLEAGAGRSFDFYARRVGEGTKSATSPGIEGRKSLVVVGLELIESHDWEAALSMCMARCEP